MSGLQPDSQTIADGLLCAAALSFDVKPVLHDTGSAGSDETISLRRLTREEGVQRAHARIERIYDYGVTDLAELTAAVVAAVASEMSGWLGLQVSALGGVMCAASMLETFGHQLDLERIEAVLELVRHDPRPTPAMVRMFAPLIHGSEPVPHVVILTPLSHVLDDERHAQLIEVAAVVREGLDPHGFAVDCPGERLHPDSGHDWSPEDMYDCERRRIMQAGGVAIVADDIPSWGLGQSQSWAESNVATVAVFANNPSRALGSGGQFDTVVEVFEAPQAAGRWIVDFMMSHRERLVEHARENIAIRQAWARQVLPHPMVRAAANTRLSARRLDSLTSQPSEAASMTLMEARQLRRTHPELADLLCDTVTGRPHSMAFGSRGQLSGTTRRDFRVVCDRHRATATEERLMFSLATTRNPVVTGQRIELDELAWSRILRFIRNG